MSKTYSLKGKVPNEIARAIAEELVKALPDTLIVGSAGPVRVVQCHRRLPATVASSNAPCSGRHRLALRTDAPSEGARWFTVCSWLVVGRVCHRQGSKSGVS